MLIVKALNGYEIKKQKFRDRCRDGEVFSTACG